MSASIKSSRENSVRRICTWTSNGTQIQYLGTHSTSCRGRLESWFKCPAFEGRVVVLGVDDGYV